MGWRRRSKPGPFDAPIGVGCFTVGICSLAAPAIIGLARGDWEAVRVSGLCTFVLAAPVAAIVLYLLVDNGTIGWKARRRRQASTEYDGYLPPPPPELRPGHRGHTTAGYRGGLPPPPPELQPRQRGHRAGSRLIELFHTKVVGVTQRNEDGSSRQRIIVKCRRGEMLLLVREPQNPHDADAVAVVRKTGEQLGYLSADVAAQLASDMDSGRTVYARIENLTGGGWLTKRTRGVNILLMEMQ